MRAYASLGLLVAVALGLLLVAGPARAGISTERVSVKTDGTQANSISTWPAITSDGRYVAFTSWASNLVDADSNAKQDVFVHDRATGQTERVSLDSNGGEGDDSSGTFGAAISIDHGRYVAFESAATNLVPGDTNGERDVFVYDRETDAVERVSVDSAGNQANDWSGGSVAISSDGLLVAFVSEATNLVAGDTNGQSDVFVHDRSTDITERVSVDSAGNQSNGLSGFMGVTMSADGRYVAFDSDATNLVAGDTNGVGDLFLRDRYDGSTERVSLDSDGNQANGWSEGEFISPDGRYVAFTSPASNLVEGDTNTCPNWTPSCLDVFIRDLQEGTTERVSVDSNEDQGNADSYFPAISGDLRYVAFLSTATNLVPGDTNGYNDVFLRDREAGATTRISVDAAGNQGNGPSGMSRVAIGLDRRFIAYDSAASNLVPGDTNSVTDVFVDPPDPGSVGGIAELPELARDSASSAGTYVALAGGLAAAVVILLAGAWYTRRRWSR